jgi:site-specific recombinase XerD
MMIDLPPPPPTALPPPSAHPAAVYLAGLAPGSRRTMAGALKRCAAQLAPDLALDQFPWAQLRRGHLQAVRAQLLEQRKAPATVNKALAALRGVVREASELGLLRADEAARAIAVAGVRGDRPPAGRALSAGEVRALFFLCQRPTAAAARDAAVLALLYGAGLRRAEVVGLQLEDLRAEEGVLVVQGKGERRRRVPLPSGTLLALRAWLAHRGSQPGPLLWPVRSNGRLLAHRALTEQAVYHLLRRLGPRAGVARFSPHDLRRTYIGELLEAGADLAVVQRLAGHRSPLTTSRYDRRPEAAQQRAVERLHVPFAGAE